MSKNINDNRDIVHFKEKFDSTSASELDVTFNEVAVL